MTENDQHGPEPAEVASTERDKVAQQDPRQPLPDGEAIAEVGDALGGPA